MKQVSPGLLYATLLLYALLLPVHTAFSLPGERNGGILFVPDVATVLRPSAFAGDPERAEQTTVFDGFPSVLDAPEAEEDLLLDDGRRIGVYSVIQQRPGVLVGQLPRSEEVPFAMVEADDEEPATLWLAELSYGTLYLEIRESRMLVDLGYLYDWYILETSESAVEEAGFLPVGVYDAHFESELGPDVLTLGIEFLPDFNRVYQQPARATMYLDLSADAVDPVAVFVTEMHYPNGFVYTADQHVRMEDGEPAYVDEYALFRTPVGQSLQYRLEQRSYFLYNGLFYPGRSVAQLWQDTLPRVYRTRTDNTRVYREPGGEVLDPLPADTRVRASEADHYLDTSSGASSGESELWFRVQIAQDRSGWIRAEALTSD